MFRQIASAVFVAAIFSGSAVMAQTAPSTDEFIVKQRPVEQPKSRRASSLRARPWTLRCGSLAKP